VGLAIKIPRQHIVSEEPANKDNYGFVVKSDKNQLKYKITYTSANESFGFHSAREWFDYLKKWNLEVEQPVKVEVKPF